MSERIRELAEQAGAEIYGHPDFATICVNGKDADDLMKKFAELIVKECVSQCWTVSELESKGFVVSECSKRIRKHFGVEE